MQTLIRTLYCSVLRLFTHISEWTWRKHVKLRLSRNKDLQRHISWNTWKLISNHFETLHCKFRIISMNYSGWEALNVVFSTLTPNSRFFEFLYHLTTSDIQPWLHNRLWTYVQWFTDRNISSGSHGSVMMKMYSKIIGNLRVLGYLYHSHAQVWPRNNTAEIYQRFTTMEEMFSMYHLSWDAHRFRMTKSLLKTSASLNWQRSRPSSILRYDSNKIFCNYLKESLLIPVNSLNVTYYETL